MTAALLFGTAVWGAPRTVRVPMERAIGGVSPAQRAAEQKKLHAELIAALPTGLMPSKALEVALTDDDRQALMPPGGRAGIPLRIGVVKAVPAKKGKVERGVFPAGVFERTPDGGAVWAMKISSPGAQAVRVHLKDVALPEGAKMYFFGLPGQVDGPYTGTGPAWKTVRKGPDGTPRGDFWTRSVIGETGVLFLRLPGPEGKTKRRDVSFVVAEVGHIARRVPQAAGPQSHDPWPCSGNAPCLIDANCISGTPADAAKSAAAKFEWVEGGFLFTCTGTLLADTDPNTQRPLFLTANHCISSSNGTLETFFFYTTDTCNGLCPDSIVTGGTPPPADTVGATILATGTEGDFSLFELNQAPPAGTVFLGWNTTPIAFSTGADLYRISNPNFGPQVFSHHRVDTSTGTCAGVPRGAWIYSRDIEGATQGGSSGSAVLNAAGEVVGQLTGCCGFNCGDECDATSNATIDGALAFYFPQVEPFLDPGVCVCGDGVRCGAEQCDPPEDSACPGQCRADCTCPPPPGDECDTCTPVIEGIFNGTTADNTGLTGDDTSCTSGDTIDEWYCYAASCTGFAIARLCGSGYDTAISVFDACGGAELACNDDFCDLQAEVSWSVAAGQTYRVRVSGWGGEAGPYTLSITCSLCNPPPSPALERIPVGGGQTADVTKLRAIAITAGDPGKRLAIRVTFVSLPPPFDVADGSSAWVGPPFLKCENSGDDSDPLSPGDCPNPSSDPADVTTPAASKYALLQCDPEYRDWSAEGVINIVDPFIVPGGVYEVDVIEEGCPLNDAGSYSLPLSVGTPMWGDLVGDCTPRPNDGFCTPADASIDVTTDVTAVLNKFKNTGTAPLKARADVEPATVDFLINIADVTRMLDAFRGNPYPFMPGPVPCPNGP